MDLSNVDLADRPAKLQRTAAVQHEDFSACFTEDSFGGINFEKQYASAYFIRLEMLRNAILSTAQSKWVESGVLPESQLVGHVKSYKSGEGDVALVGVLFKDMKLKPNVLSDIQENLKISDQFMQYPEISTINPKLSDSDALFLEDMEARLQLVFPDQSGVAELPTGAVVAVIGRVNDQGFFEVRDYCLPGYGDPQSLPKRSDTPAYVAFVSGLMIGSAKSDPLTLQLLRDFLMGLSMSEAEIQLASRIVRLVVAGDSLYVSTERDPTASCLTDADTFFAEIASVIPVDIMSGPRDPTNYCLPQQPLHSGLFPEARRYKNLSVRTNPYKFSMDGLCILGSSGQNVTDVLQYTSAADGLEALDIIARCRYLAPTAPDTLACYPFTTMDPLVITENPPSLLFASNQAETKFKHVADSRLCLVTIADFCVSPSVLLVNVHDVDDVKVIRFSTPSMTA